MLESFDFFGKKIYLTVCGEDKIRTRIGGIFFIIMIISAMLMICSIGPELILKEKPFFFQSVITTTYHPMIEMNEKTLPFSFNISTWTQSYFNLTNYLLLKLIYYEYSWDEVNKNLILTSKSLIPIVQCPNNTDGSINYNLCPISSYNLTIEGYWDQKVLKYIEVNVELCNQKQNSMCKTSEEIFKTLAYEMLTITLYFPQNSLDPSDYYSPIQQSVFSPYKFLTYQPKITNFMIERNELKTDGNPIISDFKSMNYLSVNEQQTDYSIYSEELMTLFIGSIYSSNVFNSYSRSYIKIQDLFARLGGLLNMLYVSFSFINTFFSKIKMNTLIMNEIFAEKSNSKSIPNREIINHDNNQIIFREYKSKSVDLSKKEGEILGIGHLNQKNIDINLNIYEIMGLILCKTKIKIANSIEIFEVGKNYKEISKFQRNYSNFE